MASEFELFSSLLMNGHESEPEEVAMCLKKANEIELCGMEENVEKEIMIDLLAWLETKAWKCRLADGHRTQLLPLRRRVVNCESVNTLVNNGSVQLRYAMAKLLVVVIATNDELEATARTVLMNSSTSFKLTCCRRMTHLLSTHDLSPCRICPVTVTGSPDQPFLSQLLLQLWSTCTKDILSEPDCIVDLLCTTCHLINNDCTKWGIIGILVDSWSTLYRSTIMNLLISHDPLILRHTIELLYILFSNILQDLFSSQPRSSPVETLAGDVLAKFDLDETRTCLRKALAGESWFGGRVEGDQRSFDHCMTRLVILVPVLATAIRAHHGTTTVFPAAWTNMAIPEMDLTDPRPVTSLLIEDDDHFCNFFLSCVIIKKSYPHWIFDPHVIWLHFLIHINWSDQVVLDWLASSETVFLLAFLHYLKLTIRDPASLRDKCTSFLVTTNYLPAHTDDNDQSARTPTFTISEIIGNAECTRTISLKAIRQRTEEKPDSETIIVQNIWDKVKAFYGQLERKLIRFNEKKLFGFNVQPLLRLLNRVNELT